MNNSYGDDKQKRLAAYCKGHSILGRQEMCDKVLLWNTFFRRNLHRFAETYLGLNLHLYQKIILYMLGVSDTAAIVACRAAAKSFMIAVYSVCQAILRPGNLVVIVSATRRQANIILHNKIERELCSMSPLLRREIKKMDTDNPDKLEILFWNGSTIQVVTASERARGGRANIVVYEEFRLLDKKIIDSIIGPYLVTRSVPYMLADPEMYGALESELLEEPISIYISSAWVKSHWMWGLIKQLEAAMLEGKNSLFLGFDYSIVLRHGIKTRKNLIYNKSRMSSVSWAIEYENLMVSDNTKAFFPYGMLVPRQVMKRAWYPKQTSEIFSRQKNRYSLPRQNGEIRIVSCDIAMVEGAANDNSAYACMRLLPEGGGNRFGYHIQVPYLEHMNGGETLRQAVRIKQLFTDFEADYVVLDTRNSGIAVYDTLARVLYDDDRECEYPPWKSMNDELLANRLPNPNALPILYCFTASQRSNSEMAVTLKKLVESEQIDFLVPLSEGIDELRARVPEYSDGELPDVQAYYENPYLETEALIHEMAALEYDISENTGAIKVKEPRSGMKDRYTAVAMGCYFSSLLALDNSIEQDELEYESFKGCVSSISFA